MRVFVVMVTILAMPLIPLTAVADPFSAVDILSADILLAQGGVQNLLPKQSGAKITTKQAASTVKQIYQGSKILSINLIKSKGPPVYRVKTLLARGVVKYVYVDGVTGDAFE